MIDMTAFKNFAIAGAAIISPWWLDALTGVSQAAALLLPVFGCVLAVLQLVKLRKEWSRPKE